MNCINDNEVNNIYECNLIHGILNSSKSTKNINNHYYPILHVCMNTRRDKERFEIFRILLDSLCSSTVMTRNLIMKPKTKKYGAIQWLTQPGNITTNMEVRI